MRRIATPLVLLATLSTLASCTKPVSETVVTPPKTPEVKVEVTPVSPTPAPTQTGTAVTTPVTASPQVLTRTEVVTYASPANPKDPVEFSVTVTDGVITAASATPKSDNEVSKQRQTAFAAEVSAKVVGKKAKDLDVDVIGGSSLTTAAFETFAHSF